MRQAGSVWRLTWSVVAAVALIGSAATAGAQGATPEPQDRQFLFSISTIPTERRHATVHLDSGFGDGAFDATDSHQPEQRIGVQASLTSRLALVADASVANEQRELRSSQHAEVLYSVLQSPLSRGSLALGMGVRHESGGVNVLLGRVAAGRSFSAWRMDGNALFERPLSVGRDAVDLITTFGVSRQLLPMLYAGAEVIGEDLEGFWEQDEAEGGARLLVGPSLRFVPPSQRWQVNVAGGPIVRATQSVRTSDARRGLPASTHGTTYAVRASLSYGF